MPVFRNMQVPATAMPEIPKFNEVKTMESVIINSKAKPLHKIQDAVKGKITITTPEKKNDNTMLYLSVAVAALIIYLSTLK